jgi:hypothetical protein
MRAVASGRLSVCVVFVGCVVVEFDELVGDGVVHEFATAQSFTIV